MAKLEIGILKVCSALLSSAQHALLPVLGLPKRGLPKRDLQ